MRDAKRAAAEQSLLDAAEVELAQAGYAAASMQSIAARAGVSVGTLYNYFKDKEDLVAELMATRRTRLAARLDDVLAAPGTFEERLHRLVRTVFAHFDEHRAFLRVSLHLDQSIVKRKLTKNLLDEKFEQVLAQGVKDGQVRERCAPIAAAAVGGVIKFTLIQRLDAKGSFVDIVDDTVDLILHGVARPVPSQAAQP